MFSSEIAGSKGERTRARIVDAALASFRTRGYDDTTIRLLATELGMSTGNAYHHFPTKNHLVQELYREIQAEHHAATERVVAEETDLLPRLRGAYSAALDAIAPYHAFAPGFLAAAVSPKSPINPLSSDSQESREVAVSTWQLTVEGATKSVPEEFREQLPQLLLLANLLLTLFWVYDPSPGQERTRRLVDRGVSLLGLALPLMRLPLLRGPLREVMGMLAEVTA